MRLAFSYYMFLSSIFLFSLFHLSTESSSSIRPLCHNDERSALLQFKESFIANPSTCLVPYAYPYKVASWTLKGENSSCCSWDGVDCDEVSGHVIGLNLSNSCLYGSINSSSSLFRLVHLQVLDLSYNHFNYSHIPSTIGNLSMLTHLNLFYSFFFGQIPSELSLLNKLSFLDLSNNVFPNSSPLPGLELKKPNLKSLIQNLTNLEELHLIMVDISSPIPNQLANMSSLTSLTLSYCGLVGEFPIGILQLPNLQVLELHNNSDLIGYFPESHLSSHLKYLSVGSTGFYGEIPTSIGNINSLERLDFADCNLSGLVPPSLGNLSMLTHLYLSGNHFKGQLPFSFSNLTKLTHLNIFSFNLSSASWSWLSELNKILYLSLGRNNLTGDVPHFLANFTQLTFLDLGSNLFTGHMPFWVMNLTKLNYLDLSENMLQGSIPSSISQLENLQYLDFFSNNLSGIVELDILLGLKNLTLLNLSFNKLSLPPKKSSNATLPKFNTLGLASCNLNEFPKFLQNQEGLFYLDLAFNNIHGQIPQWFWKTSTETLEYLDLSHNFLTNSNQSLFALHWSHLLVLNISSNRFQGSVPIPPPSISFYSISLNELSGEIPPLICNLNFLEVLDLSENNLSGNIPKCLGNFSNSLTILNLRINNLNGTVPHTWTSGNKLRMINLGENKLSGQVPKSIVNCAMLEILDLGNNQINDTFPFWFGNLPELKVLILHSNGFHGVITSPEFNLAFPKLRVFDVSCNSLTGTLPSKFFQTWNAMKIDGKGHLSYMQVQTHNSVRGFPDHYDYSMTVTNKGLTMNYYKIIEVFTIIDFSKNRFEGEIPESIATLKGLHTLNLSNNKFVGHIPSSMGNLAQLESMDLSQNKLSGEIPRQLAQLTFLASFNVSYNLFTGSIPQGNQFNTFPISSFEGNLGLCGSPLLGKCEGSSPSTSIENQGYGSSIEIDWKYVVIGYGSGFLVGIVIGHIMTTKKPDWFKNTFGTRQYRRQRQTRRGCRN
ncbi:hypothetical protein SO802_023047 [Lithocarpus litseifolius]|uniref:Receptor-like protein 12 n=1 Tax=Lithocarpus litseifolius TaxID=425828 RepID=A0AAW2C8A9_9ROSI